MRKRQRRARLTTEVPDDRRDAARWRALLNAPGLRVMTTVPQRHAHLPPGTAYIMLECSSHHDTHSSKLHKQPLINFVNAILEEGEEKCVE